MISTQAKGIMGSTSFSSQSPQRRRKSAFTLIELLVVIAIIAILAAILFPVFAQAREKARAIACLSNIKQLSLGWLMYTQDYDETYPIEAQCCVFQPIAPPSEYAPGFERQVYWQECIEPYVKNGGSSDVGINSYGITSHGSKTSVFICPNYGKTPPATDEAGNSGGSPGGFYPLSSYAPNFSITTAWWALGQDWAGENATVGTIASTAKPSQQLLFVPNYACCTDTWGGGGANNWTWAARRHSDGANYSMLDGHAKWYRGPSPQYGIEPNGEAPGTPIATHIGNRPNAPAFFFPRSGE